ncbi:hypothetical protein PAPYR_4804 [Paratrimastix pyriformis]|uniref:Uncharacterized protein n=1 Tax=Paratrimastix pyriformis TaxID=342808 RepID=A0ABQ8UJ80_9EUKA|nr:hypothetical protein PAPYR_4804 [Paratrimastix pyriformis]
MRGELLAVCLLSCVFLVAQASPSADLPVAVSKNAFAVCLKQVPSSIKNAEALCNNYRKAVLDIVRGQGMSILDTMHTDEETVVERLKESPHNFKQAMLDRSTVKWLVAKAKAGKNPTLDEIKSKYGQGFLQWFVDLATDNKSINFNGGQFDQEALQELIGEAQRNSGPANKKKKPSNSKPTEMKKVKPKSTQPPSTQPEEQQTAAPHAEAHATGDHVHVSTQTTNSAGETCTVQRSGTGEVHAECGGTGGGEGAAAEEAVKVEEEVHWDEL